VPELLTVFVTLYALGAVTVASTLLYLVVCRGILLTLNTADGWRWVVTFVALMLIWPVALPMTVRMYRVSKCPATMTDQHDRCKC
jgi:hypothetical protein